MLSVWDESGDGEIDFDEFAVMFEKTQLMLDVDGRRKLITFDAVAEKIGEGAGPHGRPLGITEEKKILLARREFARAERRRKRAEEEARRLAALNGQKFVAEVIPGRKRKIQWTMERSCWAPRKLETDSKDFFDTDKVLRAACVADFRNAHRLSKLVRTGPDYMAVQDYLASQYRKLLGCFRMWAASDEQFGPFQMTNFAFKEFAMTSTGICDGKTVTTRDVDNVFAAVNANIASGKPERKNKESKSGECVETEERRGRLYLFFFCSLQRGLIIFFLISHHPSSFPSQTIRPSPSCDTSFSSPSCDCHCASFQMPIKSMPSGKLARSILFQHANQNGIWMIFEETTCIWRGEY